MKKQKFIVMLMALISTVFLAAHCIAQKPSASDWEVLFNGKDLAGWKELNGKHKWEAKNGMIVGTFVTGEPNGFLCTEKDFGDFIFECEVNIDTLMNNSGVQFRSLCTPDYQDARSNFPEGRVHGYQMEVDPKPQKWSGSIYEEGGNRGWLYTTAEINPAAQKAWKNNQWNKYRIECYGTTSRTWINGISCSNLEDAKFPKGFIGLQMHANNAGDPKGNFSVYFRNLRIQTTNLKFSPPDDIAVVNLIPNTLSLQEQKNGYSLLWDGKTTAGWRAAYKTKFPEKSWGIKDGELTIVPPTAQDTYKNEHIVTEKQYSAFELKFDFKITAGANSGVKYFVNDADASILPATSAMEYQIVDDAKIDSSDVTRKLGSLADIKASKKSRGSTKRIGEWNQGVIRVLPSNLVGYWLNGSKILEYQRGSAEFLDLVAKSKYKNVPNFGMASKGNILLENNGSIVSYRSIKIRELK
jgi:hypothetical protein